MVAIYARQSVDKKDSLSIETQIRKCQRLSGEDAVVFEDKGFSGKNTKRPAFGKLMEEVKTGQITKILVYRLDRFSRSLADFGQVWQVLEQYRVEFVSVTEQFDTGSPMGRAMLNIIMTFAQLERETIADRVRDNYWHRFRLGAWPGGPAPYGFQIEKVTDPMGRRISTLIPNEKMPVVGKIYETYAHADETLGSVARKLNTEGIPGAKRKGWDGVAVSRILRSPLYVQASEEVYWYYLAKGMEILDEREAFDGTRACNILGRRDRARGKYLEPQEQKLTLTNHAGVIPGELWAACQSKLDRNRQVRRSGTGKHTWLSGLLKCGCCGYAVKVSRDGDKFYLNCSGRAHSHCQNRIQVNLPTLETAVALELETLLTDCPKEELTPMEHGQVERLRKVEEKIQRLLQALAESEGVAVSYISRELERLDEEKATLLKKGKRPMKKARMSLQSLSFPEKKMVAAAFIERVELEANQVKIRWKI